MQIAAHYSAAIEIMDNVIGGAPAERALLAWSRGARYAGSKDRAAVRDIVFECLRKRRSYGAQHGETGRGIVLGRALDAGEIELFTGEGHAPAKLTEAEKANLNGYTFDSPAESLDVPDFVYDLIAREYVDQTEPLLEALRDRAPVDLRVNLAKTNRKEAQDLLAKEYIFTEPLEICDTALRIIQNPRKLNQSRAYAYGYVELQDVSSQLAAQMAGVAQDNHVLDYCAGGGGKTLALGMSLGKGGKIDAWDIAQERMKTLPERAKRAGLRVNQLKSHPKTIYDLVFVDAPCSGSGAWRRAPYGKFNLTLKRINELNEIQAEIINKAAQYVKPDGRLVYATCSLFQCENSEIVDGFLQINSDFEQINSRQMSPLHEGDGFYAAVMRRGRLSAS